MSSSPSRAAAPGKAAGGSGSGTQAPHVRGEAATKVKTAVLLRGQGATQSDQARDAGLPKTAKPSPAIAEASRLGISARGAATHGAGEADESAAPRRAVRRSRATPGEGLREGLPEGGESEGALRAALFAAGGARKAATTQAVAQAEGEAKIEGRFAERERGEKADPRVVVLDLRRREAKLEPRKGVESEAPQGETKAARPGAEGTSRELTLELGSLGQGIHGGKEPGSAAEAARGGAVRGAQDFSALLAERLKEAWNGEIVQGAQIVLRDGDSGTIRLRLRPESLGSVKIELNLAENSVSGKIVVESDEAKTAFERNMAALHDAFREGGFDSAKLEVAVGSGGSGSGGAAGDAETPYWSERQKRAALAFDGEVPQAARARAYAGRGAVDILA